MPGGRGGRLILVSPARGGLRSSPGREAGERPATLSFLFPEPRRAD